MFVQHRKKFSILHQVVVQFNIHNVNVHLYLTGGSILLLEVVCSSLGQVISSQVPCGGHQDNIDSLLDLVDILGPY